MIHWISDIIQPIFKNSCIAVFIAVLFYTVYTLFRAPASQEVVQKDKNVFFMDYCYKKA